MNIKIKDSKADKRHSKLPKIKSGEFITFCFDSNIYISNPSLSNQDWLAFKSFIENHSNCTILIPEVVLEEIKPKIKQKGIASAKAHSKIIGECQNYGITPTIKESKQDLLIIAEKFADNYEQYLNDRFNVQVHKGSIKHVPTTELFKRSLQGKKPFRADGSDGFKDYLIWKSYLDFAKKHTKGHFIFISGNISDFSNQAKDNFHQDLLEDLSDLETGSRRFYYYNNMQILSMLLPEVTHNTQTITKTVEKDLKLSAEEIANEGIDISDITFPGTNSDECYLDGYSITDVQIASVKRTSSKSILVKGSATAFLEYLYYADKSEVERAVRGGASVNEYDYNDHVSEMAIAQEVDFEFGAEYSENKNSYNLVRYFINGTEVVPGWTLL